MSDHAPATAGSPGRAVATTSEPRSKAIVLTAVLSSTALVIGGVSVVNLAMPSMQAALHAGPAQISLVVAAYSLTYAVFLITGGRLGDIYGRRRVMLSGLALFTIAVLLGGFAMSVPLLVAARAVQGLGAALMYPQVLSTIEMTFDGAARVRAVSAFGATIGAAIVVGQLVGGLVIGLDPAGLSWRAAMFVQVPVGVLSFILCAVSMPARAGRSAAHLDEVGTAVLAVGLSLLVIPLLMGRALGWPTPLVVALILALPALGAFGWWERRTEAGGHTPLLRISLFEQRTFLVGMIMGLVFFVGTLGFALYTSVTLQSGAHFSPIETGLAFAPAGVAFLAASLSVPKIIDRLGRYVLSVGYLFLIAGMATTALTIRLSHGHLQVWTLTPALLLVGLGQGFGMAPLIGTVLSGVRAEDAGSAAGALTAAFQVGQVLGVAVVGMVYFATLGGHPSAANYLSALQAGCVLLMILAAGLFALVFLLPAPERQTRLDVFLHNVPHRAAGLGYALCLSSGGHSGESVIHRLLARHHATTAAPAAD